MKSEGELGTGQVGEPDVEEKQIEADGLLHDLQCLGGCRRRNTVVPRILQVLAGDAQDWRFILHDQDELRHGDKLQRNP